MPTAEQDLQFGSGGAGRFSGVVRSARAHDLPELRALLKEAALPTEGVEIGGGQFFVAIRNAELVGGVGLERYGDVALLRSAVVRPGLRRSGIGAVLTAHAIGAAREEEARAVYLLTTTAVPFFRRHGFQEIPRERVDDRVRRSAEFSSLCPASATVMMRELR